MNIQNRVSLNEPEVQQLRMETKGCKHTAHFNNAGASLPPDIVVDSVIEYLREEALYGGYEVESVWKPKIENTYELIAQMINADATEIAITENASIAWRIAFHGIEFEEGDEIITSELEYVTNMLGFAQLQKRKRVNIKVIETNDNGNFLIDELENAITKQTKLIAVTHISSSNGMVMPVEHIGAIARKHGILYLVDACQSVGHMPTDVKQIKCDMLSVTGRKYLRAPRGTGFLYVRREIQDKISPVYIDFHSIQSSTVKNFQLKDSARRYEVFEKNRALTIGLGKAVGYALNIGLDKIWQRICFLAEILRGSLLNVNGVSVHDVGSKRSGIVTFSIIGVDSLLVKQELIKRNINVSIGGALATPVFMDKYKLNNILRASVHYYNTEDEIMLLCDALTNIIRSLKIQWFDKP